VPLNRVYEYLTLAELRLAQGRHDEALALVRSLRRETEAIGWGVFTIRALVLESVALYRQGRSRQALDALGRALALAEPEGYVRAFIDKGPDMAQLLYQAAAQGLSPRFAGKLLAEFEVPGAGPRIGVSPVAGSRATQANPQLETLIEPLSEREVQVLALIAEGLTNREVAQRLHVSLSTVKVHTYNMYGKLDVHSRTQAVVRARALGVLDPL
jgi:LuxR family maltose regulon positive regulatory protein